MRLWGVVVLLAAGCGDAHPIADAAPEPDGAVDAMVDAGNACAVQGAPGECIDVAMCGAMADHTAYAGYCPGSASIECCIQTPSVSNNPPTPAGYQLMQQAEVTPEMTAWAVMILQNTVTYPMFATATMTFGSVMVLARVEWHPPDFQNNAVHRGVTLYKPL